MNIIAIALVVVFMFSGVVSAQTAVPRPGAIIPHVHQLVTLDRSVPFLGTGQCGLYFDLVIASIPAGSGTPPNDFVQFSYRDMEGRPMTQYTALTQIRVIVVMPVEVGGIVPSASWQEFGDNIISEVKISLSPKEYDVAMKCLPRPERR